MAYSKIILNGETLMDVTNDTVDAGNLLSGKTATKNSGAKVTGNIATKSSSDLTVSGATVTAPAGYYSATASKAVATTTHPNPTATIASSTGVVTASHTQGTGYVTGGTTTGTLNLTTQAAQTINTSTADQTIASNRWLTGAQTIKSVTTTNLTAANIAEGVTVKVGDANNASRITQITGTHSGGIEHTATINGAGNSTYCYVQHNGTKYYTNGTTFTFKEGDTITFFVRGDSDSYITYGDGTIAEATSTAGVSYNYIALGDDLGIYFNYNGSTQQNSIAFYLINVSLENSQVTPTEQYQYVTPSSAYAIQVVTVNPISSTYVGTGVTTRSSTDITFASTTGTFTAPVGYYSTAATKTITTQAAQTITPTKGTQVINPYRWLTGYLTIEPIPDSYIIPTGTSTITSNGTYDVTNYASASVSVAGGSFYGIYKSLAEKRTLSLGGTSTYTISELSEFFNSFNQITGYQFAGAAFSYGDSTVTFQNARYIGQYAFGFTWIGTGVSTKGSVNMYFPNISYVSYGAFYQNGTISYIDCSICTTIEQHGFYSCDNLRSVSFPACTSIGGAAFACCSNLSNVNFPSCTIIEPLAFHSCRYLTEVSLPEISYIKGSVFYFCSRLSKIYAPKVELIYASAFGACYSLLSIDFPICSIVDYGAFSGCSNLSYVNLPNCTLIEGYAFYGCSKLSSVSFPACTFISSHAFRDCSNLRSVSFPVCTSIGRSAFAKCASLTTVDFPACTLISDYVFEYCSSLTTISFASIVTIGSYAFRSCYKLLSLYLLGSSVASLATINAFYQTPISNYTTSTGGVYGSIYVPASLYNSYLTATNWSQYSSRFVSV